MRFRVRFRRVWRQREILAVVLRSRAEGRLVENYAAQVTLSPSGRISFAAMSSLGRGAARRLKGSGLDHGTVAYMLRALGCHLFTHAWYREHRHQTPTMTLTEFATTALKHVEGAQEEANAT